MAQEENKSTAPKQLCARCGKNGCKKYKFVFSYCFSAYMCAPCINSIGSASLATEWLERHAIFSETGKLLGFRGAAAAAPATAKPQAATERFLELAGKAGEIRHYIPQKKESEGNAP